jgi:hypothetical protein
MGSRRVLRQPERVSRRGRHGDGFRDIAGVEQPALAGISGICTSQAVGLQLEDVARCWRYAEDRLQMMPPLMGHDHDGREVADASAVARTIPRIGARDRARGAVRTKAWWVPLVRGILLILIGVLTFIAPATTACTCAAIRVLSR